MMSDTLIRSTLAFTFLASFSLFSPAVSYNPDNTEIAFDIHGVLMQPNLSLMLEEANTPEVASFLYNLATQWVRKISKHPYDKRYEDVLLEIIQLLRFDQISGEGFSAIFTKYQFPQMAQLVQRLGMSYTVTPDIIPLLHRLRSAGYQLRIASNIGNNFLTLLAQQHPDLFSHFSCAQTVNMTHITKGIPPTRKPEKCFYELLRATCNIPADKTIIFIDDLPENINSAHKIPGWIPLQFTDVQTLSKQLQRLLSGLE